jgi:uncharacterized membrane protein (DUF4010 family)
MDLQGGVGLLVAALGGAAIGLEREWSGHASGPHARFGGIRTFTLLGVLSGVAGWFATHSLLPVAVVLLAAAAGLVLAGYISASRKSIDATTEVAAIVVLAAGALSGAGWIATGSALVAATALLLLEKTRLHALVRRIDDASLRASVRFAAMACVILPLLPPGPYGPFDAVRPRELWVLVLFFSGLSFVGWLARRAIGPHQGVIVVGLLGGIISSTSVTLTFARDSRAQSSPRVALAAGAVGACTVMLLRVLLACAVLNPALAAALPRYLAAPFVLGTAVTMAAWRIDKPARGQADEASPLRVGAALQMTALFQVVLFVILAVQSRWGSQALVATSAIVGLTDLDALTLSLARGVTVAEGLSLAATALAAGIISNTVLKLSVACLLGRGAFRAITGMTLGAMALAILGMIAVI